MLCVQGYWKKYFITFSLSLFISFASIPIIATAQQHNYPILANVDSASVWFDKIASAKNRAIINGPEYHISFNGRKSHPFYQSAESDRSFVRYDNDLYKNVDLLYDIYGDILLVKYSAPDGTYFIKLDKNLVQSFDLYQHHFKKFDYTSSAGTATYFDVLFERNQFAVLVKRLKLEKIDKRVRDYVEDDIAYILDGGKWIKITGKSSFEKTISKDQRKALADFIKANHIKLGKKKDDDLMKLGAFCYSLKAGDK